MRTFGIFVVAGIFALASSCGDGNGSGGGYTSPTGRTASSGGTVCKNQTCAAEENYYSCLTSKCGAQAKTCFGPSYASGTFAGACAALITCTLACPCDATGDLCVANCATTLTADCVTCTAALQGCASASGCQTATCGGGDAGGTGGASCAAAQACCASLASLSPTYAQQCQTALATAGTTEASCAMVVQQFQAAGFCL